MVAQLLINKLYSGVPSTSRAKSFNLIYQVCPTIFSCLQIPNNQTNLFVVRALAASLPPKFFTKSLKRLAKNFK